MSLFKVINCDVFMHRHPVIESYIVRENFIQPLENKYVMSWRDYGVEQILMQTNVHSIMFRGLGVFE